MRASWDAALVEIRLDHPCRSDQLRVAGHGARHPVDVRRLECRDVAERVPVELAELDDVLPGAIEPRRLWTAEVPDPTALEGTGRGGGARLLVTSTLRA
jgi:hypothetical protein